jgi:N utilization substance protein A
MSKIRLGSEDIQLINLFEKITGAKAQDMVAEDSVICFLVSKEDMGLAIGKKGASIEKVRSTFNKKIYVMEYAEDYQQFVRNVFHPVDIQEVRLSSSSKGKNVVIKIRKKDRKNVIGAGGERIKLARKLLDRHFGLKDVILES